MTSLHEPWLIAAWPGMGAVAAQAARFLASALGPKDVAEVAPGEHFRPAGVKIQDGLLMPPRMPRTVLAAWKSAGSGRDLLLLAGEAQPGGDAWRYAESALDSAHELGVARVYTFAAMGTPVPPGAPARVFAAATDALVLEEVRRFGAEPVRSGEIGGMNGVLLAAAAQRGIPGACLLGEIPFFASAVANPKAAAAVLRVFASLAGLELDLADLERAGHEVDRQLATAQKRMEQAARALRDAAAQAQGAQAPEPPREPEETGPSPAELAHLEALFEEASRDRSKALELKAELDRLGVFARYEDRFLDLFKRAE